MTANDTNSIHAICRPCGHQYGRWFEGGQFHGPPEMDGVFTSYQGRCGVCGAEASVTNPRHYGDLRPDWRQIRQQVQSQRTHS